MKLICKIFSRKIKKECSKLLLQVDYTYDEHDDFNSQSTEFLVMDEFNYKDGEHFITEIKKLIQDKHHFQYIKNIVKVTRII